MSAKTFLYVEYNEVNRRLVRDLLKRTSYRLLEAPDGEAGMAHHPYVKNLVPHNVVYNCRLPCGAPSPDYA